MASDRSRESKVAAPTGAGLDEAWHAQLHAADVDPAALVAATVPGLGGGPGPGGPAGSGPGPRPPGPEPDLGELAGIVFDPEEGITAHRKVVSRADVLAAVAAAFDGGQSLQELSELTDRLLGSGHAVALPDRPISHLSNAARYTSPDIVAAESVILASARARYATNTAVLSAEDVAMAIGVVEAGRGHSLAPEQRAFVLRAMTAGHGIEALIGTAGAGKTVLTEALRVGYEMRGMVVAGATLAASAGAGLQAESGIPTRTIAGWLASIRAGREGLAGIDVLVVDEAAMADDRQMHVLVAEAERTGTKLIMVGDPLQLRSPGVGGTFRAVHEIVGGLQLTENRRQIDPAEREALALWRAGRQHETLTALAGMGRVHVTETPAESFAQILTRYTEAARELADVHERIRDVLVLAGTNEAADRINTGVRAVLRESGLLPAADQDAVYRLASGRTLRLAVGDQVMLRRNEYRSQLDPAAPDLLNGYRGVVREVDGRRRVLVEWRAAHGALVADWVEPAYIAKGGLSLAYALTVAKSQGMTCQQAIVYGAGLDAHTLYPALTRARIRTDLILPRTVIESPERQLELGEPATPGEALARAVAAVADRIRGDRPEDVVIRELGEVIEPMAAASPAVAQPQQAAVAIAAIRERRRRPRATDPDELDEPNPAQVALIAARGTGADEDQDVELPVFTVLAPATAEQVRARNDGQAAVPEPARPAWTERPLGQYSDADLTRIELMMLADIQKAEAAADLSRRVEKGQGPAVAKLRADAPVVIENARLAALGTDARDRWHRHQNEATRLGHVKASWDRDATRRQDEKAEKKHQKPMTEQERATAVAAGQVDGRKGRAAAKESAATAVLQAAEQQRADAAKTEYDGYVEQIGPEYDAQQRGSWGVMRSAARRQSETWDQLLGQATQTDRYARDRADAAVPDRAGIPAAEILAGARAEAALRAAMSPAARRTEDAARTQQAQQDAARQAAAEAAAPAPVRRSPTPTQPHRPPTNRSPQPGRGFGR
jgi:hypothetical protein